MGQSHAFYLEHQTLDAITTGEWALDESELHVRSHIKALRLKNGDPLIFLDGLGTRHHCLIISAKDFLFKVQKKSTPLRQSPTIHVAISPPKNDDLDRCIQICTELEVSNVFLFKSDHNAHTKTLNIGRLKKIAQSSCEQSLNPWMPKIFDNTDLSLNQFLAKPELQAYQKLIFDEDLSMASHPFFNARQIKFDNPLMLFFGPEGGWSTEERSVFGEHGCQSHALGPLILKVPTALCSALSILRSSYEE